MKKNNLYFEIFSMNAKFVKVIKDLSLQCCL